MNQSVDIVRRVIAKAPQWLRQDLVSADPAILARSEEALAAMIAAALEGENASDVAAANIA